MARRRARILAFVASSTAATLIACNLLTGLDADYKLQSTGEGGKDGDLPVDGPGVDSSSDGPLPQDGGPDTKTDGRFCDGIDKTNVTGCLDFEDAVPPNFGGTSIKADEGDASFTVDPTGGFGGTKGLKITMTKLGSPAAWLTKNLEGGNPRNKAHYEVEFEFKELKMEISYTAFAIVTFPSGGPDREHGIGNYTATYFSKLQPESVTVPDNQTWHHGRIRLDLTGAGTTYDRKIVIDATTVDTQAGVSSPTTGGAELRLGTFNTGLGTGAVSAAFDNVVIRVW